MKLHRLILGDLGLKVTVLIIISGFLNVKLCCWCERLLLCDDLLDSSSCVNLNFNVWRLKHMNLSGVF